MPGNFVYSNTSLPNAKSDRRAIPAGGDPDKYMVATDFNDLRSALLDVQTWGRGAELYGLSAQASSPSGYSIAEYLWLKNDGTLQFRYSGSDKQVVTTALTLTAGAGLTGGGTLASDRTFAVGAGSGITVNADDVAVNFGTVINTACQGNDTRLSPAPSGAGKIVYDNGSAYVAASAGTSAQVLHGGAAPAFGAVAQSEVTNLTSDLAAKVSTSRTLTAGAGLTGGGDLSSDRSFAVAYGTASNTATQGNDTRLPPAPSAAGKIVYDNGSAYVALAAGTAGKVLTANGAASPTWETLSIAGFSTATATVQTTDATVTNCLTITVADGKVVGVFAIVAGRKSDGTQAGSFLVHAVAKRTGGTTIVTANNPSELDSDDAIWNASADVSGTSLVITVKGNTGDTVDWIVSAFYVTTP